MSRVHRIVCDGCGEQEDLEKKHVKIPKTRNRPGLVSPVGKKGAVRFNLPEGWKKIDGNDVCPECVDLEDLESELEKVRRSKPDNHELVVERVSAQYSS